MTGPTALRLVAAGFRAALGEFPNDALSTAVPLLRCAARELAKAWQLDVPRGAPDRVTTAADLIHTAAKARLATLMPSGTDCDAACRCNGSCGPTCPTPLLLLLLPDAAAAKYAMSHNSAEDVMVATLIPRQNMGKFSRFAEELHRAEAAPPPPDDDDEAEDDDASETNSQDD